MVHLVSNFYLREVEKQGIPRYYLTQYYFFHETALFLHGLTDRDSLKWSATVKSIKDDFDTIDFG